MDGDGVIYALHFTQVATGEPTADTLVCILNLYLIMICGISSAGWMAFWIWRGFLRIINNALHLLAIVPVTFFKAEFVRAKQSLQQSNVELLTSPNLSKIRHDVVDSNKTHGRDSSSEQSEVSVDVDIPTPTPAITPDIKPTKQLV